MLASDSGATTGLLDKERRNEYAAAEANADYQAAEGGNSDAEFADTLFNTFDHMVGQADESQMDKLMQDVSEMEDQWPSSNQYLPLSTSPPDALPSPPNPAHTKPYQPSHLDHGPIHASSDIDKADAERMHSSVQGVRHAEPPSHATSAAGSLKSEILGPGEEEFGHEWSDQSSVPDAFDEGIEEDGIRDDWRMDGIDTKEERGRAGTKSEGTGKRKTTAKRGRKPGAPAGPERQKQRNREHARNTRARKKMYLETLHSQLQDLKDERERREAMERKSTARTTEQQGLRKQVLQTFLTFRARGVLDRRKWAAILTENFLLKLPITPHRHFLASEVIDQSRHIRGIDATVRDTASFAVLIDSLSRTHKDSVRVQFFAEAECIVQVGDTLMCRWLMTTDNCVQCGGQTELHLSGMLSAEFAEDNKLSKVAIMFDVMSLLHQLKLSTGEKSSHSNRSSQLQVAPSTMNLAEQPSDEPRIIVGLKPPHLIRSINQAWMTTYGVSLHDCTGKGLVIQRNPAAPRPNPDQTDAASRRIRAAYDSIARELPLSLVVIYVTETQGTICARLRMFPIMSGGVITHYMGGLLALADTSAPKDHVILLSFEAAQEEGKEGGRRR